MSLSKLKLQLASGMSIREIYLQRILDKLEEKQVKQDKILEQHLLYGTPIPEEIEIATHSVPSDPVHPFPGDRSVDLADTQTQEPSSGPDSQAAPSPGEESSQSWLFTGVPHWLLGAFLLLPSPNSNYSPRGCSD